MFARKSLTNGSVLSEKWSLKAKNAFDEHFEAFSKQYEFFVYAETHKDELLIIVSAISRTLELSPISLFLSRDINTLDENTLKKLPEQTLEVAENFFEEVFDTDDWSDYTSRWLETEHKGQKLYYRITRENIYLSLEADKWLQENEPS